MYYPTKEQKQLVCGMTNLSLNGMPARITGYNHDFARVTTRLTGLSAEWSWEAAYRIANSHGKFVS